MCRQQYADFLSDASIECRRFTARTQAGISDKKKPKRLSQTMFLDLILNFRSGSMSINQVRYTLVNGKEV